ncbi:MAG: hypothetical protein PUP91_28040 [Rhizonema sp. PD37]|nr:hypothetical protein [Rhizonema sp. PD37]
MSKYHTAIDITFSTLNSIGNDSGIFQLSDRTSLDRNVATSFFK